MSTAVIVDPVSLSEAHTPPYPITYRAGAFPAPSSNAGVRMRLDADHTDEAQKRSR